MMAKLSTASRLQRLNQNMVDIAPSRTTLLRPATRLTFKGKTLAETTPPPTVATGNAARQTILRGIPQCTRLFQGCDEKSPKVSTRGGALLDVSRPQWAVLLILDGCVQS
jgi:hypothetical protein